MLRALLVALPFPLALGLPASASNVEPVATRPRSDHQDVPLVAVPSKPTTLPSPNTQYSSSSSQSTHSWAGWTSFTRAQGGNPGWSAPRRRSASSPSNSPSSTSCVVWRSIAPAVSRLCLDSGSSGRRMWVIKREVGSVVVDLRWGAMRVRDRSSARARAKASREPEPDHLRC